MRASAGDAMRGPRWHGTGTPGLGARSVVASESSFPAAARGERAAPGRASVTDEQSEELRD
jgi:hypothetical protein